MWCFVHAADQGVVVARYWLPGTALPSATFAPLRDALWFEAGITQRRKGRRGGVLSRFHLIPLGNEWLPLQLLVLEPMRLVRGDAETLFALFFVGLEISFAPVDVAVPFEGQD